METAITYNRNIIGRGGACVPDGPKFTDDRWSPLREIWNFLVGEGFPLPFKFLQVSEYGSRFYFYHPPRAVCPRALRPPVHFTLLLSIAYSSKMFISSFLERFVCSARLFNFTTVSSLILIENTLYPSSPFKSFLLIISSFCKHITSHILYLDKDRKYMLLLIT